MKPALTRCTFLLIGLAAFIGPAPAAEHPGPPNGDDPDLLLWLDATERTTVTADDEGYVSAWHNKAARLGRPVTSDGAQRPRLVENSLGGKPVLRFDGRDDVLRDLQFGSTADVWTLFLVVVPRSNRGSGIPDGFHGFISTAKHGQPDFVTGLNVDMGGRQTDRFTCVNVESNKGGGEVNLLFVGTDFGRARVLAVWTGRDQTILLAESGRQSTRPANESPTSLEELRIGTRSYMKDRETGFVDADIAEVILYGQALPADRVQAISTYLQEKYSIKAVPAEGSEVSLVEAIDELGSYDWGQSRAKLAAIDAVIHEGDRDAVRSLEGQLVAALAKGVSPGATDFICRRLAAIGTNTSVPALSNLLHDKQRGAAARRALDQIPCDEAGEALWRQVSVADQPARTEIIHSLGKRREMRAVETLIDIVRGEDAIAAQAAATSLAEIGDVRAVEVLLEKKPDAPHDLLTLASRLTEEGHDEAAARIYTVLDASADETIRAAVLAGRVQLDLKKDPLSAQARLHSALMQGSDRIRGQAAVWIARVCPDAAADDVARTFGALPVTAQRMLLGLRWTRRPEFGRRLARAGWSVDNTAVQLDAVHLWAETGSGMEDIETISRFAATAADPELKTAAEIALRHLASPDTDLAISKQLESTTEQGERIVLIRAMRDRQTRGAVPQLLELAASESTATRLESLKALEVLGDSSTATALIPRLLAAATSEERSAAERAIWLCALRSDGSQRQADPLLAVYARGNAKERVVLLPVLGRFGGSQVRDVVRTALTDSDAAFRAAAVRALANWPDATVADDLFQLAQQADVPAHRIWALRGYVRVVTLPDVRPAEQTLGMLQQAWKLAIRTDEQSLILQRLPAVICRGSLEMAMASVEAPDVREDAILAAAQLAESLLPSEPQAARAAIQKILSVSQDPALRARLSRHL